jgi:hypothetical protein
VFKLPVPTLNSARANLSLKKFHVQNIQMFTHLVSPRASRICRHAYKTRRVLSTGSGSVIPSNFDPDANQDGESLEDGKTDTETGVPYAAWLLKHGIKFNDPKKPKNWLPPSRSVDRADIPDHAEGVEPRLSLTVSFSI